MKKSSLFFIFLIMLTFPVKAIKAEDIYDVALFWGQSNMTGYAGTKDGGTIRDSRFDFNSNSVEEYSRKTEINKSILAGYDKINHVNVDIPENVAYEFKYLQYKNNSTEENILRDIRKINDEIGKDGWKRPADNQEDFSNNFGEQLSYKGGSLAAGNYDPNNSNIFSLQSGYGTNIIPQFAKTYYEKTGHKLVVVMASNGGEKIANFLPSDATEGTSGEGQRIYEAMILKYNSAIKYLEDNNKTIGKKFYVVFQGEADLNNDSYKELFMEVHNNIKKETGISFGAIIETATQFGTGRDISKIHGNQEEIIKENDDIFLASDYPYRMYMNSNLEDTKLILCLNNPGHKIHFTAAGLSQIGHEAALRIADSTFLSSLNNVYKIEATEVCSIVSGSKVMIGETEKKIMLMQGVAFFNREGIDYAIYVGNAGDDSENTPLTLVDLKNNCKIEDINDEKGLGHGNDITYNSTTNEFYVTTSPRKIDNKYYIERFKIERDNTDNRLKIHYLENGSISGINISNGFAFTNNNENNNEFIYYSGSKLAKSSILDTDGNKYFAEPTQIAPGLKVHYDSVIFKNKQNEIIKKIYYVNRQDNESGFAKLVNQGIAYRGNNVYLARALNSSTVENTAYTYLTGDITGYDKDSSYILVHNANTGKYKYSMYIPNAYKNYNDFTGYKFSGHLEGLDFIGDDLWLGYNVHFETRNEVNGDNIGLLYNKRPKTITFLKYTNKDDLEEKYHKILFKKKDISNNNVISRIDFMNSKQFLNDIDSNGDYKITDKGGNIIAGNDILKTGYNFDIIFSGDPDRYNKTYKLSVLGDVTGEGKISLDGTKKTFKHIVDGNILKDEYLLAADIDNSNEIKINDAMRMLKKLKG